MATDRDNPDAGRRRPRRPTTRQPCLPRTVASFSAPRLAGAAAALALAFAATGQTPRTPDAAGPSEPGALLPPGPAACEPAWRSIGGVPGLNSSAFALEVFDPDGDGPFAPQLVAAGNFSVAGGATAFRIARFDGQAWFPIGSGFGGTVHALAQWRPGGDGPAPALLIAGGNFTRAGNTVVGNIASWDGQSWRPLLSGLNGIVHALASWDPDGSGPLPPLLIAAGAFTAAGETRTNAVASWDGERWRPLGEGMNAPVNALAVWDPDGDGPLPPLLIAGGDFTTAGGVVTDRIARWDGAAWAPIGDGFDSAVSALTVWDPDGDGPLLPQLVAGGQFSASAGEALSHIARWDGEAWRRFGEGVDAGVRALSTWDPDGAGPLLIAGGDFTHAGGEPAGHAAAWDGSRWMPLGAGASAPVFALTTFDRWAGRVERSRVVAAGSFATAGSAPVNNAASWDGSEWRALGDGVNGVVHALGIWDPDASGPLRGELVVGGNFTMVGGRPARNIARWNGSTWRPFGAGTSGRVFSLTTWDPDGPGPLPARLVAGGTFMTAGSTFVYNIAQWDGELWQPFQFGINGSVLALATWDEHGDGVPQLVAGGLFTFAWTQQVNFITRWNGTSWVPLGAGFDSGVYALESWDPDGDGPLTPQLIAAGLFTTSGADELSAIARWDGEAWRPLGPGLNGAVYALTTWDPDGDGPLAPQLVAAGSFTHAGALPARSIARWDGEQWHAFGSGLPPRVWTLAVWDSDADGPSPARLVAAGDFVHVRGTTANRVAIWDGQEWWPLGHGINQRVSHSLAWRDHGAQRGAENLFIGGDFTAIGGAPASYLAWWGCPIAPHCPPDWNRDGQLDFFDYLDFVAAFASDVADYNGDGQTDFFDYLDFIAAFAAGCD